MQVPHYAVWCAYNTPTPISPSYILITLVQLLELHAVLILKFQGDAWVTAIYEKMKMWTFCPIILITMLLDLAVLSRLCSGFVPTVVRLHSFDTRCTVWTLVVHFVPTLQSIICIEMITHFYSIKPWTINLLLWKIRIILKIWNAK
jgi:hypothetical protein